eukprot:2029203-Amphidinium_carterae.1
MRLSQKRKKLSTLYWLALPVVIQEEVEDAKPSAPLVPQSKGAQLGRFLALRLVYGTPFASDLQAALAAESGSKCFGAACAMNCGAGAYPLQYGKMVAAVGPIAVFTLCALFNTAFLTFCKTVNEHSEPPCRLPEPTLENSFGFPETVCINFGHKGTKSRPYHVKGKGKGPYHNTGSYGSCNNTNGRPSPGRHNKG